MKVVIISEYNKYCTIGGTENYIYSLIDGLVVKDVEIVFISLNNKPELFIENVKIQGGFFIKLYLLPLDVRSVNIDFTSNFDFIKDVLFEFNPDVISLHTITPFFNVNSFFQLMGDISAKIFVTLHVPAPICPKGDMIKFNLLPCDGRLGIRCYGCLFSLGLKRGFSSLYNLDVRRLNNTLKLWARCNVRIICVSNWQKKQLIDNSYPDNLLFTSRQVSDISSSTLSAVVNAKPSCLNWKFAIGFIGRPTHTKGLALLLKIIEYFTCDNMFEFHLAFPANFENETEMSSFFEGRQNVKIRFDVNASNKKEFFDGLDALVVTSFGFETGPITVLESVACGLICLVPDVGGTEEYSKTYPEYVKTYQWNNLDSVVHNLKFHLSHKNFVNFEFPKMRSKYDLGSEYYDIFNII